MSQMQLSTEEHIHGSFRKDLTISELIGFDIASNNYSDNFFNNTCVPYNEINLIDPQNCDVGKNDLDVYLPKKPSSTNNLFDPSDYLGLETNSWTTFEQLNHHPTQLSYPSNYVELSSSVAIIQPRVESNTIRSIEIVHELEEEYKPRYKSDYSCQNGDIRSPRYVSDRHGRHYVTLKIAPGLKGSIRIYWITVKMENNMHYIMPYKFQQDSKDLSLPNGNPILRPIEVDSNGFMKLYLILIKSKQDELKSAPPFEPFPFSLQTSGANHSISMSKLSPKKLIEKFQLNKSHLAFTYCSLNPDGTTCEPVWNTTVISTIMTEKVSTYSTKRKITCPNCFIEFNRPVDENDDDDDDDGNPPRKILKKR